MNDLIKIITTAIKHIQKLEMSDVAAKGDEVNEITSAFITTLEEIHEKVCTLIEENLELKREILKLKERCEEEPDYDIKHNVYYTSDGDGPFCPFCSENRSKKIRLRQEKSDGNLTVCHACRVCGHTFAVNNHN